MNLIARFPERLLGHWWIEHQALGSPGLLILTAEQRAIQFYTAARRPRRNEILKLWFEWENPGIIRFRSSHNGKSWIRSCEFNEDGWNMGADGLLFPCKRACLTELPDWVTNECDHALVEMEALEQPLQAQFNDS